MNVPKTPFSGTSVSSIVDDFSQADLSVLSSIYQLSGILDATIYRLLFVHRCESMRSKKRPGQIPLKPLKRFDFDLVNNKLNGFIFNVNRDLERKAEECSRCGHHAMEQCLSLLRVFLNFANNSYRAMRHLVADSPEDAKLDPKFVLVVPTISRQLVDIL